MHEVPMKPSEHGVAPIIGDEYIKVFVKLYRDPQDPTWPPYEYEILWGERLPGMAAKLKNVPFSRSALALMTLYPYVVTKVRKRSSTMQYWNARATLRTGSS